MSKPFRKNAKKGGLCKMFNFRYMSMLVLSTIFTMILIYVVKWVSLKYEIPVMKQVSEGI